MKQQHAAGVGPVHWARGGDDWACLWLQLALPELSRNRFTLCAFLYHLGAVQVHYELLLPGLPTSLS
jgi:hypothetical protein